MRVKMNGGWYPYDGMERPKLTKLKEKLATFIGRVNCIFMYLLPFLKCNRHFLLL